MSTYSINVSKDVKCLIESLKKEKDMPFIKGKVPTTKALVELAFEYLEDKERKAHFMDWIKNKGEISQ